MSGKTKSKKGKKLKKAQTAKLGRMDTRYQGSIRDQDLTTPGFGTFEHHPEIASAPHIPEPVSPLSQKPLQSQMNFKSGLPDYGAQVHLKELPEMKTAISPRLANLGQPEYIGYIRIYKASSNAAAPPESPDLQSAPSHNDKGKYKPLKPGNNGNFKSPTPGEEWGAALAYDNHGDLDYYYDKLGDYYYVDGDGDMNQYRSASFVYDDGLDYYYTLKRNRGLNRDRDGRRKLLQFGQNEGFTDNSSSWIFAAVFVVGFIIVLFCVIGAIIYRRRRTKKKGYNTMKISDIKIVAVSRDEESGSLSNEAYAIKMNES